MCATCCTANVLTFVGTSGCENSLSWFQQTHMCHCLRQPFRIIGQRQGGTHRIGGSVGFGEHEANGCQNVRVHQRHCLQFRVSTQDRNQRTWQDAVHLTCQHRQAQGEDGIGLNGRLNADSNFLETCIHDCPVVHLRCQQTQGQSRRDVPGSWSIRN